MELFGGWGKNGNARRDEPPGVTASDSRAGRDPRQDRRHDNPKVGQGPVQTTGLARALGNTTPEPFDFTAERDPRCEPRPDWTPPEWLRLPGVDDQT